MIYTFGYLAVSKLPKQEKFTEKSIEKGIIH